jgi:hypothetical protein
MWLAGATAAVAECYVMGPVSHILSLSIGAALLLNLVATSAAYVFGVVAWWVWMG